MPGVLRLGQYLVLHLLTFLLLPHPQFFISSSSLELGLESGRGSQFLAWSVIIAGIECPFVEGHSGKEVTSLRG